MNKNNYFVLKLVLVVTLFASVAKGFAASPSNVGLAVKVDGVISAIDNQGVTRTLKHRDAIASGDTLQTSESAWLVVDFFDLTRLVLRPNSTVVIDHFPSTMDGGAIKLSIEQGGVRVTAGTIASRNPDDFIVNTPSGVLKGGRAEWVVRLCNAKECDELNESYKRCDKFESPISDNRQWVSVYRGVLDADYCENKRGVSEGVSLVSDSNQQCTELELIPCFILWDGKLGKDKFKKFSSQLNVKKSMRPNERPVGRPNRRPDQAEIRVDRPRRPNRNN